LRNAEGSCSASALSLGGFSLMTISSRSEDDEGEDGDSSRSEEDEDGDGDEDYLSASGSPDERRQVATNPKAAGQESDAEEKTRGCCKTCNNLSH